MRRRTKDLIDELEQGRVEIEWAVGGRQGRHRPQEFMAVVGADKLAIDVAPWGEGRLKVNGHEIAHVRDAKDRRQAFRELQ